MRHSNLSQAPALLLSCALLWLGACNQQGEPDPVPGTEESSSSTETAPDNRIEGRPEAELAVFSIPGEISLAEIGIAAELAGPLAEVEILQSFVNGNDEPIEAIYALPLPNGAAIHHLEMQLGGRTITAVVQEKAEARENYEQARDAGQTATLLEQVRPNLYSLQVANILPGELIRVRIRYVQEVPFSDGSYRFHVPVTVGPRFVTSDVDPEDVPILLPPYLDPEMDRPMPHFDVSVNIEGDAELHHVESPSHDIETEWTDEAQVVLSVPEGTLPNADLLVDYALADTTPAVGALTHYDEERGGYFTLLLDPPVSAAPEMVRPREIIFVVDRSGSMSGEPIEAVKDVMRRAVQNLNPNDTFQIVEFSNGANEMAIRPLPNTDEYVQCAVEFIDAMYASGGTQMRDGVEAALSPEIADGRMRLVLFMTDGFIGNEQEVLSLVTELLGEARVFSMGVGSSVNRFLLDELALHGRGQVTYMTTHESAEEAVDDFYRRIATPVVTDIAIDWGDLPVETVIPAVYPDVFAGNPLILTGRYTEPAEGTVQVSALLGAEPVTYEVPISFTNEPHDRSAIPYLWAQRQVDTIARSEFFGESQDARAQILPIALEHGLITEYTSLIAIDDAIVTDGDTEAQQVANLMPEGLEPAEPPGLAVVAAPSPAGTEGLTAIGANDGSAPIGASYGTRGLGRYGGGSAGQRGRGFSSGPIAVGPRMGTAGGETISNQPTPAVRSSVLTGVLDVQGQLSREIIQRVVREHRREALACYNDELQNSPNLAGRIVAEAIISPDGAVAGAVIQSSTLNNSAVESCLVRRIRRWRFPEPRDGGTVRMTYSFEFANNGGGSGGTGYGSPNGVEPPRRYACGPQE